MSRSFEVTTNLSKIENDGTIYSEKMELLLKNLSFAMEAMKGMINNMEDTPEWKEKSKSLAILIQNICNDISKIETPKEMAEFDKLIKKSAYYYNLSFEAYIDFLNDHKQEFADSFNANVVLANDFYTKAFALKKS